MLKISKIKGVVFDLDGVLVDSEGIHYSAWVAVLSPLGFNLSKKEFCAFAGEQVDIIAEELIKKYNLNITAEKLVLQRRKIAIEIFKDSDIKIMPYAKEALTFFSKKNRVKVGLASGGIRKIVETKLKNSGLYNFFSVIIAGDAVKKGKPEPDIYLLAVEKLKLEPKDCLALEDTQFGVEAAKAAGLFCFAIPNEYTRGQNFSKADNLFKNLKEAIEYMKTKNLC